MKKFIGLFAQGILLGLGIGLCLGGALGLLYRVIHGSDPLFRPGAVPAYLMAVGGLLGFLGGWCLALQTILEGLLSTLFLRISRLVPAPLGKLGEPWGSAMEDIFRQTLEPLPRLFRRVIHHFLVARFRHYERINDAVERARRRMPSADGSPEWISTVVLGYFLRPLRAFFYSTYAILLFIALVLWSLPFFR